MNTNFYTTRDLQDILHVDRTTIYRMADNGRLPAMKVGNQWRFPRLQLDQWLKRQWTSDTRPGAPTLSQSVQELQRLVPMDCVRLILDTFADAFGVMVLLTDLAGRPVMPPSNRCGLVAAIDNVPAGQVRCLQWWAELAAKPGMQPVFIASQVGLLCARGFVRVGSELRGMVVVGGIAPQSWPPSAEQIDQIAREFEIDPALIAAHIHEVHHVSPSDEARLLLVVQRLADIVTHIISERQQICSKLDSIAALSHL